MTEACESEFQGMSGLQNSRTARAIKKTLSPKKKKIGKKKVVAEFCFIVWEGFVNFYCCSTEE